MDQMAVLQWVQENSIQFGGDPQRVTLVGHGTGAACIEYLTHSPTTVPGKNFNQAYSDGPNPNMFDCSSSGFFKSSKFDFGGVRTPNQTQCPQSSVLTRIYFMFV